MIFLDFLHSRKGRTLDQIQALDLSEFVSCRDHLKPKTLARIVSDVRSFLRFLTMRGTLQKDLGAELPRIRVPRDATIPSVWDHELIARLLGAVDRSSAKGKRDYAILLLACRLGLRAGGYSHAETGPPSLGGIDHRNHASEDGHAAEVAFDQRGRGGLNRLLEVRSSPNDTPRGVPQSAPAV